MRKVVLGGVALSALALLLLVAGWIGSRNDSPLVLNVETIKPGVTCPVSLDNGAYKLDRWKVVGSLDYLVESGLATGVKAAFGTWATAGAPTISSSPGTPTKTVTLDGTNNVFFAPLGGSTIAATYIWFNRATRELVEFDMVFNSNLGWANLSGTGDCVPGETRFDIQDIAAHEIGHVYGIAHTSPNGANNAQTLYPYGQAGELYKRSLASGDQAAVSAKY